MDVNLRKGINASTTSRQFLNSLLNLFVNKILYATQKKNEFFGSYPENYSKGMKIHWINKTNHLS